jgi:hypothetical protein
MYYIESINFLDGIDNTKDRIVITLDDLTLYLIINGGKYTKKYPIASGKLRTATPIGLWKVRIKIMNPGGVLGTRWMGLNIPWGNYGIHGTNRPDSIGTNASLGCIRMYNNDVEDLYEKVSLNYDVIILKEWNDSIRLPLVIGDMGSSVMTIQYLMNQQGYYSDSIDGLFGPKTQRGTISVQRVLGISPSGIFGKQELKFLLSRHRW